LLDYGAISDQPVLVVPSLINRGYILDLDANYSMLRYLAGQKLRPLLLDWGWPGAAERGYSLTDYIAGPIDSALDAIGTPVGMIGYCMGGLLALATAQRRPDRVRGLALLATPWDFRAADPALADRLASAARLMEPVFAGFGTLPIDLLQALFALVDPDGIAEKYRRFGALDPESPRAKLFVAIEDWLNDCVPLAASVARECLVGWYGRNEPAMGQWLVAGMPVKPETLTVPSFVAIPGQDRIVPPESGRALASVLKGTKVHECAAGHVSMIAGPAARKALWAPLGDWLLAL
jgi:polyhydroxyalkanoate synthase